MSRYGVIESSENGRTEIDYSAMPEDEIERRIHGYHEKYGTTLTAYSRRFSCAGAAPQEMLDVMDWDCLIRERDQRRSARLASSSRK
jgi:hypothetical protein